MTSNNIFYFNPCKNCGGLDPFGIPNNSNPFIPWLNFSSDTIGAQYSLIIGSYSGCVEYSGSTYNNPLPNINLINGSPIFSASTCENCLDTYPCYTPPTVTPPTIIGYKNECGIITILPMVVECVVSNPSPSDASNGEVSLSISGGTPPYETTWLNYGIKSPALNGLPNGSYTATTVDYWGDFTATTVCTIFTEKDCSFSGTIANYTPIPADNSNYYYTINLTMDSTSEGPYTIYYNGLPPGPVNIPTYPSGESAQNISLDDLQNGVIVKVPSDIPNNLGVFYIYNPNCPDNTVVLLVPTTNSYSDFCLAITYRFNTNSINFTYTGLDSNNKPFWTGDDNPQSTINWVNNQWIVSNLFYGNTIFSIPEQNTSTSYPNNWSSSGGFLIDSINTNEGNCGPTRKQLPPVSVNQPTCLCDGSIIFNITLDNPPFNYSIDNGVTYSSLPIFTDLCSGIYNLSVVDSLGETYTSSVTLDKPSQSTTYNLSLYTINTTPVNNQTSLVNSYETSVIVNPSLPDGATITFDLIHNNSFYSSPNSGTSILTTSTLVYKNSSGVTLSDTSNTTNLSVNTITNCQKEYIYQSNVNDVWSSLTITNNDTITISTTSRVDKTTLGECVVGYSTDSYSISNPVISGCNCCSIKIN
jgi:hypothetical protein